MDLAKFIVNPEYRPRRPSFFIIRLVTQRMFSLILSTYGFSYCIRALTTSWGYETEDATILAKTILEIKYFELNFSA